MNFIRTSMLTIYKYIFAGNDTTSCKYTDPYPYHQFLILELSVYMPDDELIIRSKHVERIMFTLNG
jgi:hypothetical protein